MKTTRLPLLASAAFVLAFTASVQAADDAKVQYEKQKAECTSGKSNQDRATCMKEAGAAFEEAKRGHLNNTGVDVRKNETDRCKALSGDEQRDCLARMKGSGTVSGSVSGGGILREKKTTEVVRPAEVVPAAKPASGG